MSAAHAQLDAQNASAANAGFPALQPLAKHPFLAPAPPASLPSMANSQSADLMAGLHCANPDCRQLDFLPFQCSKCSKVYCLAHRVCPCNSGNEKNVLVCPLCARAVVVAPGADPELAFDL